MRKILFMSIALASAVLFGSATHRQQADAPAYADGDWWKVKVEVEQFAFHPSSSRCEERHERYLVRIEERLPQTYAILGGKQQAVHCPEILSLLLDTGVEKRTLLQFPLNVEKSWKVPYRRASANSGRVSWMAAEHKVRSFEKVRTLKGELEAFKIERYAEGTLTETYYYSPSVKAIVFSERKTVASRRRMTLLDYGAGPDG